jgi:hypothetical protein
VFGRVQRPLCRLPICQTSSPGCIARNASEPRSPLCRLVPATLVGPLWPSGGLVVQRTKPTRVTARTKALFPFALHSFALLARPPSSLALLARPPSSLAGAVGVPVGVHRYMQPWRSPFLRSRLGSCSAPWLFLFDCIEFDCVGFDCVRLIAQLGCYSWEKWTRSGVFVLIRLFAARSRFISCKCSMAVVLCSRI